MAHFAQLDENNVVIRVMRISDDDMTDEDGNEVEAIGLAFCEACFGHDDPDGTYYKQTSYNTSNGVHRLGGTPLRHAYAGIGMVYDSEHDVFRDATGPEGWTVDGNGLFQPPTPKPDDGDYYWNNETEAWEVVVHPEGYVG